MHLLSTTQIPDNIASKSTEVVSRESNRAGTAHRHIKTDQGALVLEDFPPNVADLMADDGRVLWKRAQSFKMFKRQKLIYGDSVERLQSSNDGRLLLHIRYEIPHSFKATPYLSLYSSGGRIGISTVQAQVRHLSLN